MADWPMVTERSALVYATYSALGTDGNGIATQLRVFRSAVTELRSRHPELDFYTVQLAPDPTSESFDAELKQATLDAAARVGIEVVEAQRSDLTFWSLGGWADASESMHHEISLIAAKHKSTIVIVCDTPLAGVLTRAAPRGTSVFYAPYSLPPSEDDETGQWLARAAAGVRAHGHRVLSFSDFVKLELIRLFAFPAGSFVSYLGGIDTVTGPMSPRASQATLDKYGLGGIPPEFVCIGRDDPQKGLGEIAARFTDMGFEAGLTILAPRTHPDVFDPLLVDTRVRVIRTFDRDLARALASAPALRAVVCGGYREPLSNVVFEAAAWSQGAIVVAPQSGGYPEQISHGSTGLLYEFDQTRSGVIDAVQIAQQLTTNERRRMTSSARRALGLRSQTRQLSQLIDSWRRTREA